MAAAGGKWTKSGKFIPAAQVRGERDRLLMSRMQGRSKLWESLRSVAVDQLQLERRLRNIAPSNKTPEVQKMRRELESLTRKLAAKRAEWKASGFAEPGSGRLMAG